MARYLILFSLTFLIQGITVRLRAGASTFSLKTVNVSENIESGILKIRFIDTGQADSILVQFPSGRNMLVDGGGTMTMPSCLLST
jgi:beta-lactamase superfamily II metal-dependent hydrolase